MVNHLPRHPEVKGLSPVEVAGTVDKKMKKNFYLFALRLFIVKRGNIFLLFSLF